LDENKGTSEWKAIRTEKNDVVDGRSVGTGQRLGGGMRTKHGWSILIRRGVINIGSRIGIKNGEVIEIKTTT
jgi:hypothetical protein